LHAKELGFTHPATRQWIQFDSDIPADIAEVIERWRVYTNGMTRQLKDQLNGQ